MIVGWGGKFFAVNNTVQKGQKEIQLQITQETMKCALFESPFLRVARHPPPPLALLFKMNPGKADVELSDLLGQEMGNS